MPELAAAEPADVTATRTAYDTVAADYAPLVEADFAAKPLDRALLTAFAELAVGPAADIGCGPGYITAHLHALGLDTFGIDLAPAMVAVARQKHPGLRFDTGTMAALDLADASLGAVVAWYSIIHTPPERLPQVFAEFNRVLRPGGHLLLAFQAGDERVRLEQAYGHTVCYDAYRLDPERIVEMLGAEGFTITARVTRAPAGYERNPQCYLLAFSGGPAAGHRQW